MEIFRKTEFRVQIAENVIRVISQHSIEQVSFKLISAVTKISVNTIIDNFENLNNLIAFCLALSFDSLAKNLSINVEQRPNNMNGMEAFWITLVEFYTTHYHKGRLIAAYLKAPASYPLVHAKHCLAKSVNHKFEKTEHILKQYNGDIRFIAFAYLFQMANKVLVDLPNSTEWHRQLFMSDFYNEHVADELIRFTKLPIS
ncbi:hypothetical protein [Pedobacter sp. GR22-10]|uniref:hypothetical protein n=1 Tax=Pedobacter sp. GR22-10 TaxID=2994472 RepID=UPI0022463041|nr:hypothetical protein [Pedobacter sp. GR22-10]MCX2429649.1 hypothetical protein [Pedobacter sp. GR22-10]